MLSRFANPARFMRVSGTALPQQPTVSFVPGPMSPTVSTLTANPNTNVTADGTAYSTLTVVVRDASSNPIAGQAVTFLVSGVGNSLTSPALTDTNGLTTARLSSARAETKTVTARVGGTSITPSATVTANPNNNVKADGSTCVTITVILRDPNYNPVPGQTVALSVSGAGNTVSVPAATDANGQTTATLKSTRAETKTVAASVGATTLDQQPTVTFVPALIIEKIVRQLDGSMRISGWGNSNQIYQLQARTGLGAGQTWTSLGTNTAGSDGAIEFIDLGAVQAESRYYRLAAQ